MRARTDEELAETEAEWLSCTTTSVMLRYVWRLNGAARTKDGRRRLRLFGCACCRRDRDLLTDERSRKAVEVAE